MNEAKKDEAIITQITIFIKDHWALVASLGYLYMSIFGMSQKFFFFNSFGINIFEYSEINDFLLSSFREPLTLIVGLAVAIYCISVFIFAKWFVKTETFRNSREKGMKILMGKQKRLMALTVIPVVLTVPLLTPILINDGYSDSWREEYITNKENIVGIKLHDNSVDIFLDNQFNDTVILGTTDKYTFFFQISTDKVLIVPIRNIVYILHNS